MEAHRVSDPKRLSATPCGISRPYGYDQALSALTYAAIEQSFTEIVENKTKFLPRNIICFTFVNLFIRPRVWIQIFHVSIVLELHTNHPV